MRAGQDELQAHCRKSFQRGHGNFVIKPSWNETSKWFTDDSLQWRKCSNCAKRNVTFLNQNIEWHCFPNRSSFKKYASAKRLFFQPMAELNKANAFANIFRQNWEQVPFRIQHLLSQDPEIPKK